MPASWPPTATWSWWPWTTGSACSVSEPDVLFIYLFFIYLFIYLLQNHCIHSPRSKIIMLSRITVIYSIWDLRSFRTQNSHLRTRASRFHSADSLMDDIDRIHQSNDNQRRRRSWELTLSWISFVDYSGRKRSDCVIVLLSLKAKGSLKDWELLHANPTTTPTTKDALYSCHQYFFFFLHKHIRVLCLWICCDNRKPFFFFVWRRQITDNCCRPKSTE